MFRINKAEGVILASTMIAPLTMLYGELVKDKWLSTELTLFFLLGATLYFYRKVKAGTKAEVAFNEECFEPKHYWKNGHYLIPRLFVPFFNSIEISFGWELIEEVKIAPQRNVNIEHFRDQRLPVYNISANAGLAALTAHNLFGRFFNWWAYPFDKAYQSYDKYQLIGSRLMLIALFLGICTNIPASVKTTLQNYNPFREDAVNVSVQLDDGARHPLPPDHFFFWKEGMPKFTLKGNDDVLLVPYKEIPERIRLVEVKTRLCATVAPGKQIAFATAYKPVYAVNMKSDVTYAKRYDALNLFQSFFASLNRMRGAGNDYKTSDTWRDLVDTWNTVETKDHVIIAQAIDKENMLNKKALGGMVCF